MLETIKSWSSVKNDDLEIASLSGYSVVLQYHVADDENTQAWFEVLSAVEIK
jgi:hypothetical protein